MADTIVLWNKGRRSWTLTNAEGAKVTVDPNESIEMNATDGAKMLDGYPRDFTMSKASGPSSTDLARREQSLKDREKAFEEAKAGMVKKPETLADLWELAEPFLAEGGRELIRSAEFWKSDAPAKRRGRPPRVDVGGE